MFARRIVLLLTLAAAFVAFCEKPSLAAQPDQLVMFQQAGCPYCAAWNREIAPIYPRTDEGKALPLRRVDLHAPRPADLAAIQGVVYSPTFVVMHCGKEIARITGYGGKELFWELLDVDMQKVKSSQPC